MLIPLKLVRDEPLQQQLYDQIRELIGSVKLAPGTRMPSTRMLADQFSVSRMTVLLSYERLIADGFLETRPAVGTFVRETREIRPVRAVNPAAHLALPRHIEPDIGRPDPTEFPAQRWRALIRSALDRLGASIADAQPDGHPALRGAIARWLSTSRGLKADPEQIVLTSCRQQALYLAARLLLRPGQCAVIEAPCDRRMEAILRRTGARLVRIPVDAGGLLTDRLPRDGATLAYVTPEHQRPFGVAMGLGRRHALLDWAARADVTLVEEDCDGELRYDRMDAPPLMGLDAHQRVIHIGGFSTTLGPGVTTSYLVVPPRLVAGALSVRRLIDGHRGWLEESALAEFLDSGAYALHLHRLRKTYLGRRNALLESLRDHFAHAAEIAGAEAGLHIAWRLPETVGLATSVAAEARRAGLEAMPVEWAPGERGAPIVLLGFGFPSDVKITNAVRRLAAALAHRDPLVSLNSI